MTEFKVLAVEKPFMMSFLSQAPVRACILHNSEIYLSSSKELYRMDTYERYIDIVDHVVKEGKFEWVDFCMKAEDVIYRDYDDNLIIDGTMVPSFGVLDDTGMKEISEATLTLFAEFLKHCNKDNPQMVNALDISLKDGYFRGEVNDIVKNDTVDTLNNIDKEIIVRCKSEGTKYIKNYVKSLLKSSAYDKYIDINYFFRRVFDLERFNYIKFR